MIPNAIEHEAGFFLSEQDWQELETLFSALFGTGELILYSGDETFLPEMKTENMASIMLAMAQQGKRLMGNAQQV